MNRAGNFPVVKDLGNGAISICCKFCGKPVSKTSVDFGMDCEDECGRKNYEKSGGNYHEIEDLISSFEKMF